MGERPKPLASLDPLSIALPHGTEVTLRVDKTIESRRVPRGAVGRIFKALEGNQYEVAVVGVGVGTYAREELLPRKAGQLEFAQRRADHWDALQPCRVLEATVGSRAWGLATEGSDTDLRGLFALPLPWTLGLLDAPTDLVSADGSQTYWEVGKAVRQALRADPNTLEMLFVTTVRPLDPRLEQNLLVKADADHRLPSERGSQMLESRRVFVHHRHGMAP